MKKCCPWALTHELNQIYHDKEWGVPVYDDQTLFEFIILEGMQAGLSWLTILKRRDSYHEALSGFDPHKMAAFTEGDLKALLQNSGIIRNRLKVASFVKNAKAFLETQNEFGDFKTYIWQFVDGKPIINHWKTEKKVPVTTGHSDAMSRDLKKRGFTFVGPTICYAYMQAVGMVNDHLVSCHRYAEIKNHY